MPVDKFGDCTTGESGPAGPMGPIGPQGKRGVDGAVGVRGPKGDTGLKGEDGTMGQTGPQGKRGADGTVGGRGPKGLKGDTGSKGEDGKDGTKGLKGDIGPAGPKGSDGDPLGVILKWFPGLLLEGFQKTSALCYYFKKLSDFKWNDQHKIVNGFESQSNSNTVAELITDNIFPVTLPKGGYCAEFRDARLKVPRVKIAYLAPEICPFDQ